MVFGAKPFREKGRVRSARDGLITVQGYSSCPAMAALLALVSVIVILSCTGEAQELRGPARYHVDAENPSANDGNPGTRSRPWKTLARANVTVRPGDTVYVHAGRYAESIEPKSSGEPSKPIVYRVWGKDEVFLDANPAQQAGVNLAGRSHIIVIGFKADRPGRNYPAYVRMIGSEYCTVQDCHFSGSTEYYGILMKADKTGRAAMYNRLRNLTLLGCTGDLILLRGDVHHNLIDHCSISDTGTDRSHANLMIRGLRPHGRSPRYNIFVDCVFSAVHHHAVNLAGGPHHNLFDRCTLCNAYKDGNAMQMAASDNIFRRCLVIDNRGHLEADDNTFTLYTTRDWKAEEERFFTYSTAVRNHIYNNTFARNLGYAISLYYWPQAGDYPYQVGSNIFFNNIMAYNGKERGSGEISYDNTTGKISGDIWSHNLIGTHRSERVIAWGDRYITLDNARRTIEHVSFTDNIQGEPRFVDPRNGNYRLRKDSPCIDAGRPLTHTTSKGSGTSVPVQDSGFFCDGFGITPGDTVIVGANRPAIVVRVPDNRTLEVNTSLSWARSAPVSLPYHGSAPDIGVFEYVP
jgi:hypothetical protein